MPRAPPKPLPPDEAALVRRLQHAVRDSTLSEPAAVRASVVRELAALQRTPSEARRIARGELNTTERRVVRTVTNRGAAVRSRLRQRRELQRLRSELREKDERVRTLEAALRNVGSSSGSRSHHHHHHHQSSSSAGNTGGSSGDNNRSSFDGNRFASFIDQLISPTS